MQLTCDDRGPRMSREAAPHPHKRWSPSGQWKLPLGVWSGSYQATSCLHVSPGTVGVCVSGQSLQSCSGFQKSRVELSCFSESLATVWSPESTTGTFPCTQPFHSPLGSSGTWPTSVEPCEHRRAYCSITESWPLRLTPETLLSTAVNLSLASFGQPHFGSEPCFLASSPASARSELCTLPQTPRGPCRNGEETTPSQFLHDTLH